MSKRKPYHVLVKDRVDVEAMQRNIDSVKAVNKAFAATVNKCVDDAKAAFIKEGWPEVQAKKLAERSVERALYDMQTKLGGW